MARSYMRVFNAPPAMGEGTVFTMDRPVEGVVDEMAVREFIEKSKLTVEEVEAKNYVCRDLYGHSASSREVIIRPPLSRDQVQELGWIAARATNCGSDFVYVVDCRENPEELYGDIIAGV